MNRVLTKSNNEGRIRKSWRLGLMCSKTAITIKLRGQFGEHRKTGLCFGYVIFAK